jgi:hypothetical protein
LDSSHLTSDQTRKLRKQIEPARRYLEKLIGRCRELEFYDSDPLLKAALLAAMRLDDLDREAMRAGLRPHGAEKIDLDMSARDVRRA